jgi:thiol:disulfide interchange protein DsbD
MKKIVVLLVIVLAFAKGNAQLLNPVKWTTQIEKKSNGNYILTFNGVIESGWHLYSQYTAEGGSLPLEIFFKNQRNFF